MSKSVQEFRLEQRFRRRLYLFSLFVFCICLTFIFQLVSLQLIHGYENRVLAKKFVSHQEFTVAPRGLFYDRNFQPGDQPLVQNLHFIDFIIHPDQFENRKKATEYVKLFSSVMGRNYSDYSDYFKPKTWKNIIRKNKYIVLLKHMTRHEHERLAAFHIVTKGGDYVTQHMRYYTMGPAMAHVSGYIGLPTVKDLRKKLALPYQIIGKDGLELRYDNYLRGRDGVRVRHRVVDHEEQISTTEQGDNLVLTIDRKIQTAAYNALIKKSWRGTVIAMHANSGQILAIVSTPSYDPNILASGSARKRSKHIKQVYLHKGFLNLAIHTKFPPASAFKPLVALAALENSDPQQSFYKENTSMCRGRFILKSSLASRPDTIFNCWSVHGREDLIGAITNSCNVYFYHLAYKIGPSPILHYARSFNLDKKTGLDLPGEVDGLVPDQRWKQLKYSSRWYDGDTINLAIGQGFLQTTPIQMAVLYSAIANRGKIYKPYLVKEIRDSIDNHLLRKFEPQLVREIPISYANLKTVQDGMRQVVRQGTARRLSAIPLPIAGKTGTVQTRSKKKGRDHAWFASYAPYGAPIDDIIVVVVFVEHGFAGSVTAAPIAAEVFKAAFPNANKKKAWRI